MAGERTARGPADRGRDALDLVHRWLAEGAGAASPAALLADLAVAFESAGAGLAAADGSPAARHRSAPGDAAAEAPLPWAERPALLAELLQTPRAATVSTDKGLTFLCTPLCPSDGTRWLLWLEETSPRVWTASEEGALTLAGQVLARFVEGGERPDWAAGLDRLAQRQRLEDAAILTRRLAHDYGNVLTSILGFTELALGQLPKDSPVHRYLTEVHRGCQQGALFTNRLRLFARRPTPTHAEADLDGAANELRRRAGAWEPDIGFNVQLPPDLPTVAIGREPLQEVLGALLDNAREAIDKAGRVTLAAAPVTLSAQDCLDVLGKVAPGPYVRVEVCDNGRGLGEDARARLFREPFFTNKPRHRGLGLAIAYGILHSHRGGLRLEPNPRGGTVAIVFLPVSGVTTAKPQAGTGGERILVVDDDPMILKIVCVTLEQEGYLVQTAASAEEALDLHAAAKELPFELVLSDVIMPRTSGVELARRLIGREPHVRLLFMSGEVTIDYTRQDLAGRDIELLTKPFRPEGLLRAVRRALDHGPPRDVPPAPAAGAPHVASSPR